MAENKKQHYVPQFYLKQYSTNGNILFAYSKKNKKSYQVKIRDICKGNYFYGRDIRLEQELGKIETEHSRILKLLLTKMDFRCLNSKDYWNLLLFITLQMNRTKEKRDESDRMIQQIIELLYTSSTKQPLDYKIKYPAGFFMGLLGGFYGPIGISDLVSLFIINDSKYEFVCSDSPIIRNSYLRLGRLNMLGLQSPGLQIFVPLTSKVSIMLIDPRAYKTKYPIQKYQIKINDVEDLNSFIKLHLFNCSDLIFYNNTDMERIIKEVHDEIEPHLSKEPVLEKVKEKNYPDGRKGEIYRTSASSFVPRVYFTFIETNINYKNMLRKQYNVQSKINIATLPCRDPTLVETMKSMESKWMSNAKERLAKKNINVAPTGV